MSSYHTTEARFVAVGDIVLDAKGQRQEVLEFETTSEDLSLLMRSIHTGESVQIRVSRLDTFRVLV
ncbi:hypothetical protein BH09ACT10_BH09ACT10_26210 [soil metagenome]